MAADEWAVVTGASGGIGMELARGLAAKGMNVVLVARTTSKLDETGTELATRHGVQTRVVALDLGAQGGADALAGALREAGIAPRVLVNNAGFGVFGHHLDTRLADEQAMIDLNITALTRLTKLLLPDMVARGGGHILNMASTAAFQPGPNMAVYYATKAYVLSYSEALGEELSGTGVTVTALCPGPTATGFADAAQAGRSAMFRTSLPGAREVADYGIAAMERGQRVAIHGLRNRVMAMGVRFAPRALVTKLVAWISRPV